MCENEKKDDEELKFERYTHKANAFPGHLALKLLFICLFIFVASSRFRRQFSIKWKLRMFLNRKRKYI